ncbi:2',5'-phosphodiesterase 12 [Bombus impatiens]|uniref:2',5'-phosphodiesterase 12 n=1 Tax=Bombus impatiens TaxID=132113 RepID=A0A6P3DVX6_BOMIM|nr:2',5'-phosphodiesterase 12 [Bombus impatiens]
MSILNRILHLRYLTPFLPTSTIQQQFLKNSSRLVTQLNMNEAILFHEEGSKNFKMSFRYINPELNVDRQFNFQRHVDESINNFVQRINRNITVYLKEKIYRKLKKQNKCVTTIESLKSDFEDNIKFLRNDSDLNGDLTCQTILNNSSDIKLVIFDKEYILRQNVPSITTLELPSSILIDFPVYPSKFEGTNIDKSKSIFNWYKNEKNKWIHVGEGFLYIPRSSDLGCRLKISCIPKNNVESGPLTEIASNNIVEIGPGLCLFNTRHAFTKDKLSGKSFRVTSYNILANVYSETSVSKETLYPYCPYYALSMDYRKLLILKELIGYNSDIICLQEVDNSVYENDLQMSLSILNYGSIYNLKNDLREGLAIFYNKDRFDQLSCDYKVISQNTDLDEFNTVWMQIQNSRVKQTFLNRNTIIQTITLRSKENPEILIVGNTHLYFRATADHIRLLQAYYGLSYLRTFAKKVKEENPECNVSILYCGDFNSVPESGVYQLITQTYIPEDHADWKSDAEEHVQNVSIKHDMNLSSACGTPEYTNYTATFSGCLDYIFYQTDYLTVEQVIPLPSKEELSAYTGLPSIVSPSDHISLCVDLKWSK